MLRKDLMLVTLLVAILALMVVPLDPALLDVLIGINMSLSVMLLMVAIYIKHPSDFATFPSVILIGTAFRLALSIGTTRMILSQADAGRIIETFGDFVVSGSVAIGLVIFLIITVVQFLVVTKGAERVAEVGARFALDALPGKQMSIDADIRAGVIETDEGVRRRAALDKDSQFFGAMDGAMKFVKGDAIAGLIIIVINLIGGIAVGVTIHGYSFSEAFSVFSLLTVGDGLVAQIPALMMSLCAGVIVTRATSEQNTDLGSDIVKELVADARVPAIASAVVFAFGFVPGFPFLVFACSALALFTMSLVLRKAYNLRDQEELERQQALEDEALEDDAAGDDAAARTINDRIGIFVGAELAEALDIAAVEAHLAELIDRSNARTGVTLPDPFVKVAEMDTQPRGFVIELDEVPLQKDRIVEDAILVQCDTDALSAIGCAEEDAEPVEWMGLEAHWVPGALRDECAAVEVPVLDIEKTLARLTFRWHEQHLGTLFAKREFDELMAQAREIDPDTTGSIEEILGPQGLFQVFRYLIEDGVPLRPMRLVLDSLMHWAQVNKDAGPVMIAECMRGSLKRQLCQNICDSDGVLGVAMLAPDLHDTIQGAISQSQKSGALGYLDGLPLDAELSEHLVSEMSRLQKSPNRIQESRQMAVVAPMGIRRRLRNFLAVNNINIPVLSAHELSADVRTVPIDLITAPQ